jgi:hypothetical protein
MFRYIAIFAEYVQVRFLIPLIWLNRIHLFSWGFKFILGHLKWSFVINTNNSLVILRQSKRKIPLVAINNLIIKFVRCSNIYYDFSKFRVCVLNENSFI